MRNEKTMNTGRNVYDTKIGGGGESEFTSWEKGITNKSSRKWYDRATRRSKRYSYVSRQQWLEELKRATRGYDL